MAEPWLTDTESQTSGFPSADQETIALLEEEIARLEGELRMHDLVRAADAQDQVASRDQEVHDGRAEERIVQLGVEVAAREETIALLLDQIRLADEAEAASRAEWEQLHLWVQEVERRVAESAEPGTDLRDEIAAERRNTDLMRQAAEKEQRSWDVQRQALVAEVERLRARFSEVAGGSDATVAAVQVLEHENLQLRAAHDALTQSMVPAHEMDTIVQELETTRTQHTALAKELQKQRDDGQRERNEHEANLNALRTELARDTLRRKEEHIRSTAVVPATKDSQLEADMRIRAFREHLKEIHQDESEQRMRRGLAARLSRLWNHTSTKP